LDLTRQPIELTREELYQRMWAAPRVLVAGELGMSSNGLAKICDRLMIPYPAWGFWTKQRAGKAQEIRPLGPPPEGAPATVVISPAEGLRSRRPRSRLNREDRMNQVLDLAAAIVIGEGASALSLKEVARRAGVSEALIYTYWSDRSEMFAALARREIQIVTAGMEYGVGDHTDTYEKRVRMATLSGLKLAVERGRLLQSLLSDPAVRDLVRRDYRRMRGDMARVQAMDASQAHSIPMALAMAHIQMSMASTVRLGKYLGARQIQLAEAVRLADAVHIGGIAMRREGYRKIIG